MQFSVTVTRWCCCWRKQRRRTGAGKGITGSKTAFHYVWGFFCFLTLLLMFFCSVLFESNHMSVFLIPADCFPTHTLSFHVYFSPSKQIKMCKITSLVLRLIKNTKIFHVLSLFSLSVLCCGALETSCPSAQWTAWAVKWVTSDLWFLCVLFFRPTYTPSQLWPGRLPGSSTTSQVRPICYLCRDRLYQQSQQ